MLVLVKFSLVTFHTKSLNNVSKEKNTHCNDKINTVKCVQKPALLELNILRNMKLVRHKREVVSISIETATNTIK